MAQRKLQHVLGDCRRTLNDCRLFAADAHQWSLPGSQPHISKKQRGWITELAFLRAFLALESFLEESFLLYSLGQKPPKGRRLHRFTFPPNRKAAEEWVIPEGRQYAVWDAFPVSNRAQRFFLNGGPFTNALRGSQAALEDAKIVRNAIAHDSAAAHQKFDNLVRRELGTLPSNLGIGSFLGMTVPASTPPQSFLELYLDKIELVATQIVPSP